MQVPIYIYHSCHMSRLRYEPIRTTLISIENYNFLCTLVDRIKMVAPTRNDPPKKEDYSEELRHRNRELEAAKREIDRELEASKRETERLFAEQRRRRSQ